MTTFNVGDTVSILPNPFFREEGVRCPIPESFGVAGPATVFDVPEGVEGDIPVLLARDGAAWHVAPECLRLLVPVGDAGETARILSDITAARRDDRSGGDYPFNYSPDSHPAELSRHSAHHQAEHWKRRNADRKRAGGLSWDGLMVGAVWAASAEADPVARRAALVRAAAVVVAAIEALDRQAEADAEHVVTQ